MFVIFNELRKLDTRLKAGEINDSQYEKLKSKVLSQVPDAFEIDGKVQKTIKAPSVNKPLWDMLLLWAAIMIVIMMLTWAITLSVSLSLTAGITILAAFMIKLFVGLK